MNGLSTHLFQALSSYRSSEGYHQRRLKLKAENNLHRKILLSAGTKKNRRKESSPYLAYIASHWKDVVAENPKMNGYQVQKRLWNNWYSLEKSKRWQGKKIKAADDPTYREKPKTSVEESTMVQVGSRSDKEIKHTNNSSSIVDSPQRKVKLIGRSQCLEKELMKPVFKKVSFDRPTNLGWSFQLPPGCTLVSHVQKEEQAELHVKEKVEMKANAQINVTCDTTVIGRCSLLVFQTMLCFLSEGTAWS